jgi:hypothetical protein
VAGERVGAEQLGLLVDYHGAVGATLGGRGRVGGGKRSGGVAVADGLAQVLPRLPA